MFFLFYREAIITTPELEAIINEVRSKAKLDELFKRGLSIQLTRRIDFYFKGLPNSAFRTKAFVYIPQYLNVSPTNPITKDHIVESLYRHYGFTIGDESKWATESGKALLKSFYLSPSEKKFLILYALYSASSKCNQRKILHFVVAYYGFLFLWNTIRFNYANVKGILIGSSCLSLLIWLFFTFNFIARSDACYDGLAKTLTYNKYNWRSLKYILDPKEIDKDMVYAAISYFENLGRRDQIVYDLNDPKGTFFRSMHQTTEGYVYAIFSVPTIHLVDALEILYTMKLIVENSERSQPAKK